MLKQLYNLYIWISIWKTVTKCGNRRAKSYFIAKSWVKIWYMHSVEKPSVLAFVDLLSHHSQHLYGYAYNLFSTLAKWNMVANKFQMLINPSSNDFSLNEFRDSNVFSTDMYYKGHFKIKFRFILLYFKLKSNFNFTKFRFVCEHQHVSYFL